MSTLNHPAALLAIILILIAGVSFTLTDGIIRIVVGAACILGLLVCARQLAVRTGNA